jgi:hypothetical protein
MLKSLISISAFICCLTVVNAQQGEFFGEKFDISKAVDASQLPRMLENTKEVSGVIAKGKISSVCQAMGCWMKVDMGNGKDVMIKFGDHAFTLPKDVSGQTAVFAGTLMIKTTSVKELRHLAEDAGKTKEEIEKITEPKEEIRFQATGVYLIS